MSTSTLRPAELKKDYPIKPISFTNVKFTDEFWQRRMETNRKVTIPYDFQKCERTGRIGNFAKAGGLMKGKFRGLYFDDSDVYKVIEGAAYSLALSQDAKLGKYLDVLIDKIAAAQWSDGYLYTFYSLPRQPEKRWTDIKIMHELYCAGHFFEAAVAYCQATGKRKILDVAIRLADHIDSVFGLEKKRSTCGHEEIEIGLVKLFLITSDRKYLKLAKFFLDERGYAHDRKLYGAQQQDHKPVIRQEKAVGHAVRAGYLYCGMADVAAMTRDSDYVKAIDRIWKNVVFKKLYLTGGIGARHRGEAFGNDYELPNATAYNETCAAIANAMWNHRLFLLHGDAKYIDVLERTIYNGFLSGVSMDGKKFFYPNPLESDGKYKFNHGAATRQPWFSCSCCPTNVARFLPSLNGYAYACRGDDLHVNLFVGSSVTVKMEENAVRLKQETRYPWDGAVKITVSPKTQAKFTICVRIPGWTRNKPLPGDLYRYARRSGEKFVLKVNGRAVTPKVQKGFARISRTWKKGDVITLNLPMPPRRVLCNEKVAANRGRVAIERGPIVYCAEWPDNRGRVLNRTLTDNATLTDEHREDMLGGVTVIRIGSKDKPDLTLIPYYAWSHRGEGEMAVWLRRTTKTT